ncbi:MAG: methyltransferase domain-containing protein [Candidatus Eisenbacteria bacterium]|nr:methyltransferase domain-containing protein [Candidatus Eisenbacteria bacterium]
MGLKADYYRFLTRQGPADFSRGIPYARCVEYPEVVRRLALVPEDRLLDVGSRYAPLPQVLALRYRCSVVAVDPEPDFAERRTAMARRVPEARRLMEEGRLRFLVRDAAGLPFEDGHFAKISAISVVEHIADERPVIRELARVLAPGGRLVLSVPYDPYRDEPKYYRSSVYVKGRRPAEEFYQRFYNDRNLEERLVEPSGLRPLSIDRFGEAAFNAHNRIYGNAKIPWPVRRLFFQPFAPILAPLLIRPLAPERFRRKTKMYTADMAILVLEKPGPGNEARPPRSAAS